MVRPSTNLSPAASSTGLERGSLAYLRGLLHRRPKALVVASGDHPLERSSAIREVVLGDRALPLVALIAEYTATFGPSWSPATRRKHADDFRRYLDWLRANALPESTASLDFRTLIRYVEDLR